MFTTMDFVMEHVNLKHKCMLYSDVVCKFDNCDSKFTNVYSLQRHIFNKHYTSKELTPSINSKQINDTVIGTDFSDTSDFSDASAVLNFDWNNLNNNDDRENKI